MIRALSEGRATPKLCHMRGSQTTLVKTFLEASETNGSQCIPITQRCLKGWRWSRNKTWSFRKHRLDPSNQSQVQNHLVQATRMFISVLLANTAAMKIHASTPLITISSNSLQNRRMVLHDSIKTLGRTRTESKRWLTQKTVRSNTCNICLKNSNLKVMMTWSDLMRKKLTRTSWCKNLSELSTASIKAESFHVNPSTPTKSNQWRTVTVHKLPSTSATATSQPEP